MTTGLQYNPLDPAVRANPYPLYHLMRADDPVRPSDFLPDVWVLLRHEDVSAVLHDRRFSSNNFIEGGRTLAGAEVELGLLDRRTMLTSNPPDHTRLRGLVSKAFTPRMVEGLRPRIQQIVDTLLHEVASRGRLDLIADFAYPLPVTVIAEMLGISPDDRERFRRWSDDVIVTIEPLVPTEDLERAGRSAAELQRYFEQVVAQRRRSPGTDLMSALIAAEEQGDRLSQEEMYATCVLLLVAGHETTKNLIGNGMLALMRHPDQLQLLCDDPSLIDSAVEELLRYDSPVQSTIRFALEDVEIGGKTIAGGQMVVLSLGAANRDPEAFPNPDRLDIRRAENHHLSFGHGLHFCLGAPLARLEGQIAITTLLRRMPGLRLDAEEPEWLPSLTLRGLASLPLSF
jgi:cytochrome P450